jgi:sulfite reductase alpha subunit-like flavoprotein
MQPMMDAIWFFREKRTLLTCRIYWCNEKTEVAELLKNQGTVMICGSLSMLKGVYQELDKITASYQLPSVDDLKKQGKVLVDCY